MGSPFRNVNLHIVGFDISREDWSVQLAAMTQKANGRYWPAGKAAALKRELRSAIFGIPEQYVVLDKAGTLAGQGKVGEPLKLKEGQYTIRAEFAGQSFDTEFWINTDSTTAILFDAARVPLKPAGVAATQPVGGEATTAPPAAAKFCTNCGQKLPEGAKFCTNCGTKTGE